MTQKLKKTIPILIPYLVSGARFQALNRSDSHLPDLGKLECFIDDITGGIHFHLDVVSVHARPLALLPLKRNVNTSSACRQSTQLGNDIQSERHHVLDLKARVIITTS